MKEIFENLFKASRYSHEACLATVVATEGTAPRKEGSKMLVVGDSTLKGAVTIGGCADAQVIEAAQEVARSGRPQLLRVELGEEDALEIGLTCAGVLCVFVEPAEASRAVLTDLESLLSAGSPFGLLTVTRSSLPSVKLAGKAIVTAKGDLLGSLGPDDLNQAILAVAKTLLSKGISRAVWLDADCAPVATPERSFVEVFIDTIGQGPDLYVFGAGQVAVPITRLAGEAGFRVHVVDSRPLFANADRFPTAAELLVGFPGEIAARRQFTESSFALLVSHAAKHDLPVLEALLHSTVRYIGVLGGARRAAALSAKLRSLGFADRDIERLHIPVGLDLGAETAEQIAVAVVAELMMVRSGRTGKSLRLVKQRQGVDV
jgi:xanthine dehydrogenase accessory factor